MIRLVADDIDVIYRNLCETLGNEGTPINGTLELNNVMFTLTNINNNIVNIRNISKSYLFGELIWYMTAREDVEFISKFSKFWTKISDDGVKSNSAYGNILFKRHGFNQVDKIIELLKSDNTSRRAVLNFNVPNPNVIETKDEICTIALQMYIRDNKLNCTAIMRSNDIYLGTPYDVAFFTELQKYVAHRVGVAYGTFTHFVTSLHAYDRNLDDIREIVARKATTRLTVDIEKIESTKHVIESIVEHNDKPKETIIELFELCQIYNELPIEEK